MIRVGVVGAMGYGARELIRLLGMHPEAEVVAAAELEGGKRLDELMPALRKTTDVVTEEFDAEALAKKCDVVFMAVPGTKSMPLGKALRAAGVRTIDETKNRLAGSADSYTFYGRDVYAFTGARLASGVIPFAEVGPRLSGDIVRIPYQKATATKSGLHGSIPILDVQYGNVWSNIPRTMLSDLGAVYGDRLAVTILHDGREIFAGTLPFARSFGDVPTGDALVYANSLGNLSVALNCDDFAAKHAVAAGAAWEIHLRIVAR